MSSDEMMELDGGYDLFEEVGYEIGRFIEAVGDGFQGFWREFSKNY